MEFRAIRIVVWLAALAVFAVIGAWAMLPWFVSSDVVRDAIERELTDLTGRTVRVTGSVEVDLFPTPIARLGNLQILRSSTDGTAEGPLLVVDTTEVPIPISSLLVRQLAFTQFRLIRPVLRIGVGPAGETGEKAAGRLGRALATIAASDREDTTEISEVAHSRLGTVTIENGMVEFSDMLTAAPEKITAVSGSLSWPRVNEALSADLTGIWRGAAFAQTSEIDDPAKLFTGQITGARLGFQSEMLNYAFSGKLGVADTLFADGAITLATPSLRQALEWLEIDIESGKAIGDITLAANVKADNTKIRFEDVDMTLQGNAGVGVLEIAIKDVTKPAITATLDFADLDIVSFLSAFIGFPQSPDAINEPVSTAFIDQLDVDLRLSAATAHAGAFQFSEVAAVTQIRNGYAVFEIADAAAYGGRLQSRFWVGHEASVPTAELGVSYDSVDTSAVAQALKLTGLFPRGLATGNLNVSSPVETWDDLIARAAGTLEVKVTNGQIFGIGFATLADAIEEPRFFRLQESGTAGAVFSNLAIDATIQDGVVIIDEGTIEYPEGEVRLSGVIPYGTASIALTTVAQPVADATGTEPPASQHFIGGSWTNPYATPVLPAPTR